MDNPFAQQQKILLYVFPVIFAVSGVNFPIGVLLYWLTTNVWTMGQQFYVIRRNPAPGSPAFDALEKRKAEKAKAKHEATAAAASETAGTSTGVVDGGEPGGEAATGTEGPQRTPRQRQQPRRQPKRKR
jgi:YidC/Oxa1 family membrane protein insertase